MEALRYLIKFFVKTAFGILFLVCIWWLVSLLFPALSFSSLKQLSSLDFNILPSPRAYNRTLSNRDNYSPKEFIGYSSSSNSWKPSSDDQISSIVEYSNNNTVTTNDNRALYIRNLSVYANEPITSGFIFTGEARNDMFINGTFPIMLLDGQKRNIATVYASSTGTWSISGWSRFRVQLIYRNINDYHCSIIFQQAIMNYESKIPVRILMPVLCQ